MGMFHLKIMKKELKASARIMMWNCYLVDFFKDFYTKLKLWCYFANFKDGIRELIFGNTSVEDLNGFHTSSRL